MRCCLFLEEKEPRAVAGFGQFANVGDHILFLARGQASCCIKTWPWAKSALDAAVTWGRGTVQQCICVPGTQPSTQTGSTEKGGEELQPPEPPTVWWPFLLGLNLPEQQPLIAMGKRDPAGCLRSPGSTSSHLPCQLWWQPGQSQKQQFGVRSFP